MSRLIPYSLMSAFMAAQSKYPSLFGVHIPQRDIKSDALQTELISKAELKRQRRLKRNRGVRL